MFGGLLATGLVALASAALAPAAGAATITPTVATDDITNNGNCTLREAVQASNTDTPRDLCPAGSAVAADRIVLEDPLYLLTIAGSGEIANQTGDLDVIPTTPSPLTIESDLDESEIDGTDSGNIDRVIEKSTGAGSSSLTLDRIRLDDGEPPAGESGGALRVVGATKVTLNSSRVTNSDTDSRGGGMLVVDDLTLNNSTVSGNASTETGGEIGAGIRSNGDVTINASTITGNHVDSPDDAVVDDVIGGGISASIGSLTIVDSTISNNAVNVGDPSDTGGGGGVYAEDIPVTIEDSTIANNALTGTLGTGGGVFYRDSAPIDGALEVQNSTFSTNDGDFQGGGLQVFGGDAVVRNTTFTNDTAGNGKAIQYDDFGDAASSFSLGGSILSEGGVVECGGPDPIDSHGYNIDRGTSCALANTGDQASTNPGLLGLAANGGPTLTHALPAASPALDQIPAADCDQTDDTTPLVTDQRGAPRGFDEDGDLVAECDVGAYELNRCQGLIANVVGAGVINGTAAAEVIVGSDGGDSIDPREGNDRVCGGGGNDSVIERPNGGSDVVAGEGGSDRVSLGVAPPASPAGTIDLASSTASQTGMSASLSSIENALGSTVTDTLIGDGGPNTLDGGIGDDAITGNGGADTLIGGNNDDQLFARDGVGDSVDCGNGTADSAQTDQLSLDSVTGCESLDFLSEPQAQPAVKKCRKGFVKKKVKGKIKCVKKKKKKGR